MSDQDADFIIPRYKMIMLYDIHPNSRDSYYEFVLGEFVPTLQDMGMYITEAWQTQHGQHPERMAAFVSETYQAMSDLMESPRWAELEERFLSYVSNYSYKIVPYRPGFQFILPN